MLYRLKRLYVKFDISLQVFKEIEYRYNKTMFSTNFQPKYIDVKTKINQSIIISLPIYIYRVSYESLYYDWTQCLLLSCLFFFTYIQMKIQGKHTRNNNIKVFSMLHMKIYNFCIDLNCFKDKRKNEMFI